MAIGDGVGKYVEGGSNAISGVANFMANILGSLQGRLLLLILVILFVGWLFFESAKREQRYYKYRQKFR